jgi:adenylate cyclase
MSPVLKFIRKPYAVVLIVSLFVFLTVLGLRYGGRLEFLELSAYDLLIRMRPNIPDEGRRVTIIEISEEDIQALGSWPLTDSMLAKVLGLLLADNPRAVGVDIFRDIPVPPGREELEKVFLDNPHLIGIMTIGANGIGPLPAIRGTDQSAFGDILVDPGGTVRRGLFFLDDGQSVYTSFALTLAMLFLQDEGIVPQADPENPEHILLNRTSIPPLEVNDGGYSGADVRGYQFLIDYRGPGNSFRTYQLADLLAGKVPSEAVSDRIILVGVRAHSVHDSFYTPLSRGHTESQQMPGIFLHANILDQILRFALDDEKPISTMQEPYRGAWILFWSLLGGVAVYRVRSASRFALIAATGLSILFLTAYLSLLSNHWLPSIPPALAFLATASMVTAYLTGQEKKTRALLMQIFSSHVSNEIAEMIWEQREQFMENGRPRSQEMTVTILFSDLKGFTSQSEKMRPQELIDWLNRYMEVMAGVIMAHGGVIDNFIGDAIKADFGVPLARMHEEEVENDAINAVQCALAMERELHRLNEKWKENGIPSMGMRIGIHTGPVVAGLLGSSKRLKYTTLGDTVNTASRLESLDKCIGKELSCRILISEDTKKHLGSLYCTERVGEMHLKGKEKQIAVHRIVGMTAPLLKETDTEVTNERDAKCLPHGSSPGAGAAG